MGLIRIVLFPLSTSPFLGALFIGRFFAFYG
jgi:hypothetical protein